MTTLAGMDDAALSREHRATRNVLEQLFDGADIAIAVGTGAARCEIRLTPEAAGAERKRMTGALTERLEDIEAEMRKRIAEDAHDESEETAQ